MAVLSFLSFVLISVSGWGLGVGFCFLVGWGVTVGDEALAFVLAAAALSFLI